LEKPTKKIKKECKGSQKLVILLKTTRENNKMLNLKKKMEIKKRGLQSCFISFDET